MSTLITLVSYLVAKKGHRFVFTGAPDECKSCRFYTVCVGRLRPGHAYEVVEVLGIKNRCPVNEYVITVKVREVPIEVAIPTRLAVEGMTVTYEKIECNEDCPHKELCKSKYLPSRCRVKIVKVKEKINCAKGLSLTKAEVLLQD